MIITFNIHSTEIASSQTAPLFLYRMASSNDPDVLATLKNVILLLVPSQNPDGEQLVGFLRRTLCFPCEIGGPSTTIDLADLGVVQRIPEDLGQQGEH